MPGFGGSVIIVVLLTSLDVGFPLPSRFESEFLKPITETTTTSSSPPNPNIRDASHLQSLLPEGQHRSIKAKIENLGKRKILSQSESILALKSSPQQTSSTPLYEKNIADLISKPSQSYSSSSSSSSPSLPPSPITLRNGERQIGNPISISEHLHEKVGGQEELDVTDAESRLTLTFRAGFGEGLSSIPLEKKQGRQGRNTNTVTKKEEENVNVGPKDSNSILDTNIDKPRESLVIKGKRDGESRSQFSSRDNNKNETETNRPHIHPTFFLQNAKVVPKNPSTLLEATDGDIDTIMDKNKNKKRSGVLKDSSKPSGDLPLVLKKEGGEKGPCFAVIVNQTTTTRKFFGGDDTDSDTHEDDMDKWMKTLVKTSQCVANCFGRLAFVHKYEMSPRKGINELGVSVRTTFPVGIISPNQKAPPNYNGDIITFQDHFRQKLLSTCQKTCRFPEKYSMSMSPISIRKEEETNKARRNPKRNSPTTTKEGVKVTPNDKNSSSPDAKTTFHLSWPKVISPASTVIKTAAGPGQSSSLSVVVYAVIVGDVKSSEDLDANPQPQPWKLIDQTVAQGTQISLPQISRCGEVGEVFTEKTIIISQHPHPHHPPEVIPLKVIAVSAQGLEKVFSGLMQLSLAEDKSKWTSAKVMESSQSSASKSSSLPSASPCCQNGEKEKQHFSPLVVAIAKKNADDTDTTNSKEINPTGNSTSKGLESNTSQHDGKANEVKVTDADVPPSSKMKWGLRTVSMVYENFLVVTEVSWNFPSGISGKGEEKGPQGDDENGESNNNVFRRSSNNSGGSESEPSKGHQFLLTWEIFGGGLRGNLVTDMIQGTISLWPDTIYNIQVGLIDPEKPDLSGEGPQSESPRKKGEEEDGITSMTSSSPLSQEQEQHQNYMSNLLGAESIIFPLADSDSNIEPKVVLSSERILVNTSQVSVPRRSLVLSQGGRRRSGDRDERKSNNPHPSWQGKKSGEGENTNTVMVPKVGKDVRPITILGGAVSRNGNEEGESGESSGHPRNALTLESSENVEWEEEDHDHEHISSSYYLGFHTHNKKYYHKDQKIVSSGFMLGDSPDENADDDVLHPERRNDGEDEKVLPHNRYLYNSPPSPIPKKLVGMPYSTITTEGNDKPPNENDHKRKRVQDHSSHSHQGGYQGRVPSASSGGDGYPGIFSLNMGLGGYNYNYDHDPTSELDIRDKKINMSNMTSATTTSNAAASLIYSIFILLVAGIVCCLFIVAFIGFFVLTSSINSISKSAQQFLPKRLRVWVVGGDEGELLTQGQDDETEEAGFCDIEGRYVEDLEDEGNDWGEYDREESRRRQTEVDLTHRT